MPSRWAREYARGLTDHLVRRPLWLYPPGLAEAIKHERRRRFNTDIDDVDAPAVFDE